MPDEQVLVGLLLFLIASLALARLYRKDAEKRKGAGAGLVGDIDVNCYQYSNAYRITLTNIGGAPARNVDFEFEFRDGQHDPIPDIERKEKLPVPELAPGKSCPLMAGFTMGNYPPFDLLVTWLDPPFTKQTRRQKKLTIYVD